MAAPAPPVPKDLEEAGWACKESKSHPGNFFYYKHSTGQAYWTLSKAYAAIEWEKAKNEPAKQAAKGSDCDRVSLRNMAWTLVVCGLLSCYLMSFICYHDGMTFWNWSMIIISGLTVLLHLLVLLVSSCGYENEETTPGCCYCVTAKGEHCFLSFYCPLAFMAWTWEFVLLLAGYLLARGGESIQASMAHLDEQAGGGIMGKLKYPPTLEHAMDGKAKWPLLIFFILLNLFTFLAQLFGSNRRNHLAKSGILDVKEEVWKKPTNIRKKGAEVRVVQHGGDGRGSEDKLLKRYDTLFSQYEIEAPNYDRLDEEISSAAPSRATSVAGSVGGRSAIHTHYAPSHKVRKMP